MGRYLDALIKQESSGGPYQINLNNPFEDSYLGSLGTPIPAIPGNLVARAKPLPAIPELCRWIGINPAMVSSQQLFVVDDFHLYELGNYSVREILVWLLSWQANNYTVPFPCLSGACITPRLIQMLKSLPNNEAAVAMWWINREASNES